MNILILGGTGAIGTPLIKQLVQKKDIYLFVTTRSKRISSENLCYIYGDAQNETFFDELMQKTWDVIIDFMIYSTTKFQRRIKKILDKTSQYIFLSSATEFAKSDTPLTETSKRLLDITKDRDFLLADPYPLAKARCEDLLRQSGMLNWTIVRPYITFSEYRLQLGCFEKEEWLFRALHGSKIHFSRDIASKFTTLTYAGDVAKIIAAFVNNKKTLGEDFNVTTDNTLTWHEVLDIYLNTLERKIGYKQNVLWTDYSLNLCFKSGQWHARYDRLYDRIFNNAKLRTILPDFQFSDSRKELVRCLSFFLEHPVFRKIPLPLYSRLISSYIPISQIPGLTNKLRCMTVKFMPEFLFNSYFGVQKIR